MDACPIPWDPDLVLTDGVVVLRPYRLDDVEGLYEAALQSVAEVGRWLPWCHAGYTREEAVEWVRSREAAWHAGDEYSFVIQHPRTGQFAGGCGLNQLDPQRLRANLGYWIRTSLTGQGLATAATRLVAQFGFEQLRLQRIEIVAAVGNLASQCVAEKAGAHREGVLRRRLRISDQPHDAIGFSLIPEDLAAGAT